MVAQLCGKWLKYVQSSSAETEKWAALWGAPDMDNEAIKEKRLSAHSNLASTRALPDSNLEHKNVISTYKQCL